MKGMLVQYVVNWIQEPGRDSQFGFRGVVQQEYGFSIILEDKLTKNRFIPTLIPTSLVQKALVQKDVKARSLLDRELDSFLVKELISG